MTDLKTAIAHNLLYVIESVFTWFLVCFAHVIGMTIHSDFVDILPIVQFVVYILAGATSILTMYKISKELKKKK